MEGVYLLLFLFCLVAVDTSPQCQNGGFTTVDGTCNCINFWKGDDCSQIICLNGGYATNITISGTTTNTTFQRCVCPSGYLGVHCEAVGTVSPPLNLFPNKKGNEATFNLVFINLLSNYWGGVAYTQLQTALNNHFNYSTYTAYNLLSNDNAPTADNYDPNKPSPLDFKFFPFQQNKTLPSFKTPGQYSCYLALYLDEILSKLILGKGLKETAITIFTQHPPTPDTDSLDRILQLAVSFDIRINVIWSDDPTFVRCNESDADVLRTLAKQTGGLFVTLPNAGNYSTPTTIMDTVLATHFQYEPVTMAVSPGNGDLNLSFIMNIPDTKSYYVVLSGATEGTTTVDNSNCRAFDSSSKQVSSESVWSYALSGYAGPTCSLSFTNVNQVQVFGYKFANAGPISVGLFKSYVEDPTIDTSNVQPDEGNPLYVAVHVEGNNNFGATLLSATFYQGDSPPQDLHMTTRTASMEYISQEQIICDTSKTPAWVELSLQGSSSMPENRYIVVTCQSQQRPSTAIYSYMDGEEDDETPTATSASPTASPKSFILAYSDLVLPGVHSAFVLAAIPNSGPFSPYDSSFGEILFDTTKDITTYFGSQDNYQDFNTAVQTENYYNQKIQIGGGTPSKILEALVTICDNISDSSSFSQNSVVAVNVGRLPADNDELIDLSNYYQFVMKNVKVVFFIGTSTMSIDLPYTPSVSILNQIAAITSGHVIVYDDNDMEGFSDIVGSVLSSGPGQNLLLSKNLPRKGTPPTVLGTIDLLHVNHDLPVYITLTDVIDSQATPLIPLPPVTLSFVAAGNHSTNVLLVRQGTSNYYVASTTLLANNFYTLSTSSIYSTNAKAIRVWTSYDNTAADVQTSYYNLNNTKLEDGETPDTYEGASLVTKLEGDLNVTWMSMVLSDCTGQQIKLYDRQQTGVAIQGDQLAHFVPFFCTVQNSTDCFVGTEKLYTAQLTSDSGYISSKSFICEKGESPVDQCNHQDAKGNYICGGKDQPYTRGPSGQLIDCSGEEGRLYYNTTPIDGNLTNLAPFQCNCSGQGLSCADAKCHPSNIAGGAVDMVFRTYTVILAIDPLNNAAQIATHAKGMLAIDSLAPSNIWLYQLITYCNPGQESILYIGTDYTEFQNRFKSAPGSMCNGTTSFDLNKIFETSLKAVGRQQRGLVVFYTEMNGNNPYGISVDKERFIETAQQYRQELYIFNLYDGFKNKPPVNVSSDLIESIMSTGGTFIPCDFNVYDPDDGRTVLTNFFTQILTVPSTFNGHSTLTNTTIDVTVEDSKTTYFLVGSNAKIGRGYTAWKDVCEPVTEKDIPDNNTSSYMVSDYGAVCLSMNPSKPTFPVDVWYSVVVLESEFAQVPRAIFIQSPMDDEQTSVAVNYTTGGPTMAIYSPEGYESLTNEDATARSAERTCTYSKTTVNAFQPLSPGYQNIKIDMTVNGARVTKVFPFGVSSNIKCSNNEKVNTGLGQCSDTIKWTGPDDSRPICQNGGLLSTWGTACNCRGTRYGGQFCELPLIPIISTTAAPTTTPASSSISPDGSE